MTDNRISPAEPVSQLRHVKIVECGEELVDFLQLCPGLLFDRPRFRYRRETLLRRTVAEKLCEAERLLPNGYRLLVVEGWRPPHIQRRMYRAVWDMILIYPRRCETVVDAGHDHLIHGTLIIPERFP